ncbi:tautomerase PptA [Candidatus Saccharibacteria bacterium]|jgi:4-oxalocrotonate tautomerase|nr:tautomerase PptA [Candidatus Saccharibacteria bacterium]HHT76645.1 tautomerase PptA [Clostridiaceae bacterium]
MPHVDIKCYPGRTEEQKQKCTDKIAEVVAKTLDCDISSVSVSIRDIQPDDWKATVWDKSIVSEKEFLYKAPGYTCE